jgi:hypothetical protein
MFNSVYAELSRKELVSYTLDFYTERNDKSAREEDTTISIQKQEKTSRAKVIASSMKKITQQKKILSTPKVSSKQGLGGIKHTGKKQENSNDLPHIQKLTKKTVKEKEAINNQIFSVKAITAKESKPSYGTKLSFSKIPQKTQGENISLSKINRLKNETKNKTLVEKRDIKSNRLKATLKNIHPYIIGIGEFTNNLYQTKTDPVNSYVTKLYPGFEFKRSTSQKKFDLYLNAGLQILRYATEDQNDHTNPYGKGFVKYGLGKFGFITSASVMRTRGTASDVGNQEVQRFVDSWIYEMGQDFKINFNKLETDIQYNRGLYSYVSDEYKPSNHIRNVIALRNSLKILPKTKIFVEYAHGWLDYDKNIAQNFAYDKYIVGLKGKIFKKLEGTIKGGYSSNKRKSVKDLNGKTIAANLTYKASPRLNYRLNVVQGLGDINLLAENITKYQGISLGCSYLPPFLKKIRLNGDVSYYQRGSDYQTRDNYLLVSFNPEYRFRKWLLFGLKYTFEDRTSKTKLQEFKGNTISLSVNSEF